MPATVVNLEKAVNALCVDLCVDTYTRTYLLRRLRNEGCKFVTVTLPKLAKSILTALETGMWKRPTDFAWKGGSLRFFRSLLSSIFDRKGQVLPSVCPVALAGIRQLCEYFYKLALPFSEEVKVEFEEAFLAVENDLEGHTHNYEFEEECRKTLEFLYPSVCKTAISDVYNTSRPRHGPGTFSGSQNSQQAAIEKGRTSFGDTSHNFSDLVGFFKPYVSCPRRHVFGIQAEHSELLFVPKDSRGPRVIIREPAHNLKAQLGVYDWITKTIERESKYRVNFQDQSVNRELARLASVDRKLVTADLKEASDRVIHRTCRRIFRNCYPVRFLLKRTRTPYCKLPSGRVIKLKKVAGMGSGITFPVLALLIHVVAVTAIWKSHAIPKSTASKQVYVYGDDLIFPRQYRVCIETALKEIGLRINFDKTFEKSYFRESCGGDYYYGNSVGPVRLKLPCAGLVPNGSSVSFEKTNHGLFQLERHCRELVKAGLTNLADYYYGIIEKHLGHLPYVGEGSPLLGRFVLGTDLPYITNQDGSYELIEAWYPVPVSVTDRRQDVYTRISSKLRDREVTWREAFSGDSPGLAQDEVSLPRKIRLAKGLVSALKAYPAI